MARPALRFIAVVSSAALLSAVLLPEVAQGQSARKYWVYFRDKGPSAAMTEGCSPGNVLYQMALRAVSPRSLARRSKVLPPDSLVDVQDISVFEPYADAIKTLGGILSVRSRWLNAASYRLTPEQAQEASALPFVAKLEPVRTYVRTAPGDPASSGSPPLAKPASLDYGQSYTQLAMIGVPALHRMGITGRGILVGMLDSGFRWRAHEALQGCSVVAEYDFVFHRPVTANGPDDAPNQDAHGTLVFSVIGGYMPGKLIGAAYGAEYALAKTEYIPTETRTEEDNWAAAIEWMDSLGVDVASSSVGYNTFDYPDSGYSWDHGDFNGKTSITARAAARAARLGILVCTSMGNEGNGDGVTGTLLTPADADSIVSVGAVSFSRHLAYFSSTGPTNDGRTKPDVVAPGMSVFHAVVPGPDTYGQSQGTSVATPLAAGSAALLLSARPELSPVAARDTLRQMADTVDSGTYPRVPNNFTGWGLVDPLRAVLSRGVVFSNEPLVEAAGGLSVVRTCVLSEKGILPESVLLRYSAGDDTLGQSAGMQQDSSSLFPTSGWYSAALPVLPRGTPVAFTITSADSSGNSYQSPAPALGTRWHLLYGYPGIQPAALPAAFSLLQNYPNPFNSETTIGYDLNMPAHVTLQVYDILGRRIATLVDEDQAAGPASSRAPVRFAAGGLATGVYFYRLSTPSFSATRKMLIIR